VDDDDTILHVSPFRACTLDCVPPTSAPYATPFCSLHFVSLPRMFAVQTAVVFCPHTMHILHAPSCPFRFLTCDMGKEADLERSLKIPERAEGATQCYLRGIGIRNWGVVVTPDQEIAASDHRDEPETLNKLQHSPRIWRILGAHISTPSSDWQHSMSARANGLVKMSATCAVVRTNTGAMTPDSTTSRNQ